MTSEVTSRFTCVTSVDADPSISSEIAAEDAAIAHLHVTLGAGLTALKASNISRPLLTFCKETGTQFPARLDAVETFCREFRTWQIARKKKPDEIATWSTPAAFEDIRKVVVRKVWPIKLRSDTIYGLGARHLVVLVESNKFIEAKVHESIGHAVKHNEDVKSLMPELVDAVQSVLEKHRPKTDAFAITGDVKALLEYQATQIEDKADD